LRLSAPRVAIISKSVARTLWPGGDVIGQRINLDNGNPQEWLTIIGVVDDVRQERLTEKAHPAVYQPYTQVRKFFFLSRMAFAVRTAAPPAGMATAMRGVLQEVDSDIIRMILKRSLLLAAVGVALGVAGALAVTRALAKFLFEVTPTDLPTFLGVAALLVAVALLSGLLPARRATRVDPLIALRWE